MNSYQNNRQPQRQHRIVSHLITAISILLLLFQFNPAMAGKGGGSKPPPTPNPGDLDANFGVNGVVALVDQGMSSACYKAQSVALQIDGKILTNTDCPSALIEYSTDGSLDLGFGNGLGYAQAGNRPIHVLENGQILVATQWVVEFPRKAFAVQRFNADGNLDTTFGTAGTAIAEFDANSGLPSQFGNYVETYDLDVQSDGNIVVTGAYIYYTGNGRTFQARPIAFALARFTANGNLDTTFGTNGKLITDIVSDADPSHNPRESAFAVKIQNDDSIVVAGFSTGAGTGTDLTLVRYLPDGSIDTGFGINGVATTNLNIVDQVNDISILADGNIVVAGWSGDGVGADDIVVARYDTLGNLDPLFGTNGVSVIDGGFSLGDKANALAVQTDGKIIVAGYVTISIGNKKQSIQERNIAVLRLNTDGSLDSGFATEGIATHSLDNVAFESASDVVIQNDGKIVVSAEVLLRYNP